MHENPIRPKGRIDACKSYMAQGTYRCMKILYGPRDVYMHVNPIWPKGRIDAWKSYMAQGTYIVYTSLGQYYRRMEILYCTRDVYMCMKILYCPRDVRSVKVLPCMCNLCVHDTLWYIVIFSLLYSIAFLRTKYGRGLSINIICFMSHSFWP